MQLNPGENFVISRVLERHNDSSTYYIQAVVKRAIDNELLATVNLTDNGGQDFSNTWQVAGDPSGNGFYIVITTTVYTDSGYSTKSATYGQYSITLLVADRMTRKGMFGGGGESINYKRIRNIVTDIVSKIPGVDMPDVEAIIKTEVSKIKPEKVDLTNLEVGIQDLVRMISVLPEPEKIDLKPVIEWLEKNQDGKQLRKAIKSLNDFKTGIKIFLNENSVELRDVVEEKMDEVLKFLVAEEKMDEVLEFLNEVPLVRGELPVLAEEEEVPAHRL